MNENAPKADRLLCGPPPENATQPCLDFLNNEHRLFHYIGTVFILAERLDTTLDLLFPDPGERRLAINYTEVVADDRRIVEEILITRTVDFFLTYVSHLLKVLYYHKPEILQQNIQVRLSDILRLPDRATVIQYAIDDYVRKLSYQGLRDLYQDIKRQTGFRLFVTEDALSSAIVAIGIRNILVHNNGVVDSRLAADVSDYRNRLGKPVGKFEALTMARSLVEAVASIDDRARRKWGLPPGRPRLSNKCGRLASYADHEKRHAKDAGSHSGHTSQLAESSSGEHESVEGELQSKLSRQQQGQGRTRQD